MTRHKKVSLIVMTFALYCYGQAFAVENYGHADYMRTLNRSASVGTLDSMFFNPAGTVRLPDGIYVQAGISFPVLSRGLWTTTPAISIEPEMKLGLPSGSLGFVYKQAGTSIFLTLMPVFSHGVDISDLPFARTGFAGTVAYGLKDMSYELTVGAALSFNDIVAMSFGARLVADVSLQKIKYSFTSTTVPTVSGTEVYDHNVVGMGGALHIGLLVTPTPWFGFALNLHSPGISAGMGFVNSVVNPTGSSRPSVVDGQPQTQSKLVRATPARADLGFLFNINDVVQFQLTGQAKVQLFQNSGTTVSFDPGRIDLVYGGGLGVDFNISRNFIWGFGALYLNEMPSDLNYYNTVESFNIICLQSITFGTGISFFMGKTFGMSISAMYPLYFTTENGFKVIKFNRTSNQIVETKDFYVSIGLNFKIDGLF